MSKFDFSKTISKVQASFKKDTRRAKQFGDGNNLESITKDPKDYVVMPKWWMEKIGILGLKFGHVYQIAGDSDTGKTSLSVLAMKQAQEQGHIVIYVETEQSTSPEALNKSQIAPEGIITIRSNIVEHIYDNISAMLEGIRDDYPDEKVLLVIDSYGQTISMRDSEMKFSEQSAKVGGASKINRMGLEMLIAKMEEQAIALLIVNYNYANIGSVGRTEAGGNALYFHSKVILQSSRVSDYIKTVKGEKVKAGVDVRWKVKKNRYLNSAVDEEGEAKYLASEIFLRISDDGINLLDKKEKD